MRRRAEKRMRKSLALKMAHIWMMRGAIEVRAKGEQLDKCMEHAEHYLSHAGKVNQELQDKY